MSQAELFNKQQEFIRRIKAGERELIPELWELLMPLTHKIISRYIFNDKGTRLYEYDDLLSLSYIALCAALHGYDSDKGAFSTYYFMHIQHATAELRGTRKRHDVNRDTVSLNGLMKDGENTEFLELQEDLSAAEDFDNAERRVYLEQLREAFAKLDTHLTDRERQVIHEHYYDCRTFGEIAADMQLSRESVRSIEAAAMRKYKIPRDGVDLSQFLDYDRAYRGTGLQSFRHSGVSSVERFAEYRERIEQRINREFEIRNSERCVSYGKAQAYINGFTDSY